MLYDYDDWNTKGQFCTRTQYGHPLNDKIKRQWLAGQLSMPGMQRSNLPPLPMTMAVAAGVAPSEKVGIIEAPPCEALRL